MENYITARKETNRDRADARPPGKCYSARCTELLAIHYIYRERGSRGKQADAANAPRVALVS